MVWCWELTQGHGKTQINTIKLCKVLLALVHSKLNVPCIHTSLSTRVCISKSLWPVLMGRSVKVSLLLAQPPQLHLTSLFGLS